MELFREDGCLTDEGLRAMLAGRLDELGRLEAAEHLSYCDKCMDRYTALLTEDVLETPPKSLQGTVMRTIWVRLMQNTYGRAAVAGVAAVLALSMWHSGAMQQFVRHDPGMELTEPPAQSEPYHPIEDKPVLPQKVDGKPVQTRKERRDAILASSLVRKIVSGIRKTDAPNPEK